MAKQSKFFSYLLNRVGIQSLLVIAVVVFGFLVVDGMVVRHDLTEDARFSISASSHKLANSIEDPLTIRAFFSDNIPEYIVPMQRLVFDVLAEYEAHGNGKIKIERINPLESTQAAAEAREYGVRPIQLRVQDGVDLSALEVFGSIALIYRDQKAEIIDIAKRYPQGYEGLSVLEYEISSKIWQLINDKPTIGLCGYLASTPPQQGMPGRGGQPRPEFEGLRRFLGEEFVVQNVNLREEEPDAGKIPLLLVVRPKEFSDVETYRLDQYLMKGGRVLMFVTQGEVQPSYPPPGSRQRGLYRYTPFSTGLDKWLEHHGLRIPNEFVVQSGHAYPTEIFAIREIPGFGRTGVYEQKANWFWPVFSLDDSINKDNPATQTLSRVIMLWPHPIDVLDDNLDGKTATVLLQSHNKESWRWKDKNRIDRRHLTVKDVPPRAAMQRSPVAVALEGKFTSYYADNAVPPSLGAKKPGEKPDENPDGKPKNKEEKSGPEVVKASTTSTQLVVIGNAIVISDNVLGGQQANENSKGAALLAFNLVDWLARSKDLIALRAKKYNDRRLEDPDYKERKESLDERAENQEITRDEYETEFHQLAEKKKSSFRSWRWINVLVPCLVIFVAGALVWILRSSMRSSLTRLPKGVAPDSTDLDS